MSEAEFWRVVRWLDAQGVKFYQGHGGEPCYFGGHRLNALAKAYAEAK